MQAVTITCPLCGFAKEIPEDKVPKSEVTVTCPRCKKDFPLSSGRRFAPTVLPPEKPASRSPALEASHVPPSGIKPVVAKEFWKVSSQFRHLVIVMLVLFVLPLLVSALIAIRADVAQTVYLQGTLQLIFAAVFTAFMYWRFRTPLFVLSSDGIRIINTPFASGQIEAAWHDIIGITVLENRIFGTRNVQIRLLLGRENSPLQELSINPKIAERPNELLERLQQRLPPLKAELLIATGRLAKNSKSGEVRYGSYILSSAGIAVSRNLIPWSSISEISTPQFVLSGYGGLSINCNTGIKPARLKVAPKMAAAYQEFVRTLLANAPQATIDPGLAKIIDCPPEEARKESVAILLLVIGLVLTLAAIFLSINYEPVVTLKAAFTLATAAAGIVPFAMAVQLFVGRLQGKVVPVTRLLSWAGAACAGPVIALLLLFLLFPSARYSLVGDLAFRGGDLDGAARHYNQALAHTPGNLDAAFALGLIYREKKDYAKAFDCLQQVYKTDPKNWDAFGIELIPDSLLKAGRFDEASDWCDRITNDHPRWTPVVTAMTNKKKEIIRIKKQTEG